MKYREKQIENNKDERSKKNGRENKIERVEKIKSTKNSQENKIEKDRKRNIEKVEKEDRERNIEKVEKEDRESKVEKIEIHISQYTNVFRSTIENVIIMIFVYALQDVIHLLNQSHP